MPTALDRRSGAVCGEKSPKTRLARIYCYGNTLYIVNLFSLCATCLRGRGVARIFSDGRTFFETQ